MLLYIYIGLIALCALIGFIVGLVKGVSRVKTWAMELLCTAAIAIPVSRAFNFDGDIMQTAVVLGLCVGLLLVFMLISVCIKRLFKYRAQGFGRFLGAITLAVKGAMVVILITVPILAAAELVNIESVNSLLGDIFEWSLWGSIKPYVADFFLIAFMMFFIKQGFKSGIAGVVWAIIKVALFCGVAYLAYYLSFNAVSLVNAANSLAENVGIYSTIAGVTEQLSASLNAAFFAKCTITVGICVLGWIVLGIICFIISRILDGLRDGAVFSVIDGIFGAIVMFVVFMGIIMVVMALLASVSDLGFMINVNKYLANNGVASVFFDRNPLLQFEIFEQFASYVH